MLLTPPSLTIENKTPTQMDPQQLLQLCFYHSFARSLNTSSLAFLPFFQAPKYIQVSGTLPHPALSLASFRSVLKHHIIRKYHLAPPYTGTSLLALSSFTLLYSTARPSPDYSDLFTMPLPIKPKLHGGMDFVLRTYNSTWHLVAVQ